MEDEKSPTKQLKANLPASLHKAFKLICIDREVSLQNEVIRLVTREVAKAEASS